MTSRDGAAGVTLVEMLVALVLFALVGLASFTTLDTILRVRERTEGRLERIARIDRALLLFSRDVMQAADVEGDAGTLTVARTPRLDLVWAVEEGTLRRRASGPDVPGAVDQALLPGLEDARFRYLDDALQWSDAWPSGADAAILRAVELRVDLDAALGSATRLVEVLDRVPQDRPLPVVLDSDAPRADPAAPTGSATTPAAVEAPTPAPNPPSDADGPVVSPAPARDGG